MPHRLSIDELHARAAQYREMAQSATQAMASALVRLAAEFERVAAEKEALTPGTSDR
jgi:hypothetical protein